ncbi:hypothetical protein ACFSC1_15380 [Paracoccus aurantiacus]|uniref:hypothetical protein n=1 Tax=Paracoccus aurantiacus TaxID=2599412 RepID=UPI00164B645C|nr:hypothetical protein [Paracoccus aurantiacus]
MAGEEQGRFDAALKQAGLKLDARDKAAALRVFLSLERAALLLKAEEAVPDEPR